MIYSVAHTFPYLPPETHHLRVQECRSFEVRIPRKFFIDLSVYLTEAFPVLVSTHKFIRKHVNFSVTRLLINLHTQGIKMKEIYLLTTYVSLLIVKHCYCDSNCN